MRTTSAAPIARARLASVFLLATALLAPAAGPAAAAEPIRDAIDAWLAPIDASPEWSARYSDITVSGDTATVSGLTFASEGGTSAFDAAFGKMTIEGYQPAAGGGWSARRVAIDRISVDSGPLMRIEVTDITLDSLAVPALPGLGFDSQRPFTSIIRTYGLAAQASLASGRVGEIKVDQTVGSEHSLVTYANTVFTNVGGGKIESMTAGPLVMTSPNPEGLLQFSIQQVETSGTDFAAFVHVFDDSQYAGGVGDRIWRTMLKSAVYRDMAVQAPGMVMTMHEMSMEDFRVRQPVQPFGALMDRTISGPPMSRSESEEMSTRYVIDLLSAFGYGRFRIQGMDIVAEGLDRFHVGEFHINDASIEGVGELGLSDLDIVDRGTGAITVHRFAFGNLVLPDENLIRQAIRADQARQEVNPLPLIPHLGYVELGGLKARETGGTPISLDRARLTMEGYVGPIPTAIALEVKGLTTPTSLADRTIRSLAQELGYTSLTSDYGFAIDWNEADSSVRLDNLHANIANLGSLSASIVLGGLTRTMIENPTDLGGAISGLLFNTATLRVTDDSLLGRILERQAKEMNVTADAFREQIASAIPFTLMVLRNSGFQAKIGAPLQNFIRNGGSLTLTATPKAAVPFTQVLETARTAPQSLPDLLSIDIVQ